MRKVLVAVAFVFCVSAAAQADPKKEALLVIDKWAKAFSDSDVDGITKLHAPDALFMGTGSKTVVVKTEAIRAYFDNALNNNKPRGAKLVEYEVAVLSDTAVLITGLDALSGVRDGTPFTTAGRVTLVVAKRGPDWKIVHFHRSLQPK